MSRGLGKWQRLLYDAVTTHTPKRSVMGYSFGFYPSTWLAEYLGRDPTEAERQAVYRAARSLVARGLVRRGRFYDLFEIEP